MVNLQLAEYVLKRRQNGDADETIKNDLISNQWNPEIIAEALGTPINPNEHIRIAVPQPSHLFGFDELLSETFRMFKDRFFSILLLLIVPGLLIGLVVVLMGIVVGLIAVISHLGSVTTIISVILMVLFGVVFIIFQTWCTIAVITSLCSSEKISFSEAFKRSWKNIFPFILINILLCAVVLGGMVLLIIPAFIFSIWFNFSNFVLVTDGDRGFNALMRSREYVKGHGWFVLGRYLLMGLLNLAIYLIMFVVFGVILKMDSSSPIYAITSSLYSLASSIFVLCYSFQLFSNLRDVRGKFDLQVTKKSKIVFSIISFVGVFVTFVLPIVILLSINPLKQMEKAKESEIKLDQSLITHAVEEYYSDVQAYPKSLNELVPTYFKTVPTAPEKGFCFTVSVTSSKEIFVDYVKDTDAVCNIVTVE